MKPLLLLLFLSATASFAGTVSSFDQISGNGAGATNLFRMPNIRRVSLITVHSTGTAQLGDVFISEGTATFLGPTATEGSAKNSVTPSATSGQAFGDHSNANYRVGRNIYWAGSLKLQENSNERVWYGMTDAATISAQGASDTVAGNYAMFRYSTAAGDTKWQCITMDGATQTVVNSNVTVDTAIHLFQIGFVDSASKVLFYIDGVLVGTITTHLPTSGSFLRIGVGGQTLDNVNKNLRYEWLAAESDR